MLYYSTRSIGELPVSSAAAIVEGLAPDGGLYTMPAESIPQLSLQELSALDGFELAAKIISALLTDFTYTETLEMVRQAYGDKFPADMTPCRKVGELYFTELYHGPSSAFKDVALSLLPILMKRSAERLGDKRDIYILTATSGDTGKAAMEGFCNVEGIKILVFYPRDGVSRVQELQMRTQRGDNVRVCAVEGNFDDAQSGVKRCFESASSLPLSSANSINIGRLVPQIVYYFASYLALVRAGDIKLGDEINFSVPTGNFGDILAGYLAKLMGLPVGRLICASNRNNVLTDFINTGVYNSRRPFYKTQSPSMDILISSNLERLLYLISGDGDYVRSLMTELKEKGSYTLDSSMLDRIQSSFSAYCCDDEQSALGIRELWQNQHYLCDTHTAVAYMAAREYISESSDNRPTVILSTASPYKFPASVLSALGESCPDDELSALDKLHELSAMPIPRALHELSSLPILHNDCISVDNMEDYVSAWRSENG